MVFNPDPAKQAQEVIFSRNSHSPKHPDLYFNSLVVEKMKIQKHLGLKLVEKLNLKENLKDKLAIVKVGLSPSKKICFNCFNESPIKIVKILFISS